MKIHIDYSFIKTPFERILFECSNTVHVCVASIESLEENPDYLVGSNNFQLYPPYFGKMDLDKSKYFFKDWIIKKGLEDLIKGVSIMMLELYKIVDKYEQILDLEHINEAIVKGIFKAPSRKKIHKLGLPALIRKVEKYIEGEKMYKDQILSINNMRNCLVHRDGLVSSNDKLEDGKILKVKWSERILYYVEGEKKIRMDHPEIISANGYINFEETDTGKEFQIGDKVSISFEELNEIIWTFFRFGEYWLNKLKFDEIKIDKAM